MCSQRCRGHTLKQVSEKSEKLPLFPLGTVLFPGLVLPLHIFEERYRQLVRDLLEQPAEQPRQFAVVAIDLGHEVGSQAARRLSTVGCIADVRDVTPHEDGKFDIVAVGDTRCRVEEVDDSGPYLQAEVTPMDDDPPDPEAQASRANVATLFEAYCGVLGKLGAQIEGIEDLPEEPLRLSYVVAASLVLDRTDKQQLLEAEDVTQRLHAEQQIMRRELRLLTKLGSVPGSELLRLETSNN